MVPHTVLDGWQQQQPASQDCGCSHKSDAADDGEIQQLLGKGVLEETDPTYGQYVSTSFLRKKNYSYRLNLNLRGLNASIEYQHFKMENLTCAIQLMKKTVIWPL